MPTTTKKAPKAKVVPAKAKVVPAKAKVVPAKANDRVSAKRPAEESVVVWKELVPGDTGGFKACHVKHHVNDRARAMFTPQPGRVDECVHAFITPVGRDGFEFLVGIDYSPKCKTKGAAKLFVNQDGGVLLDAVPRDKPALQLEYISRALEVASQSLSPETPLHKFLCKELGAEAFALFSSRTLRRLRRMSKDSPEPYSTAIRDALALSPPKATKSDK